LRRRPAAHAPSDLAFLLGEIDKLNGLLSRWVKAYDEADERGIMSDHGNHDADLEKCPGCRMDVICEDARELMKLEKEHGKT